MGIFAIYDADARHLTISGKGEPSSETASADRGADRAFRSARAPS